MASSTKTRVSSAIVMILMLIFSFWMGALFSIGVLLVLSLLVHDEVYTNFFKRSRFGFRYCISLSIVTIPLIYLGYYDKGLALSSAFLNAAVVLNFILLVYLFKTPLDSKIPYWISQYLPFTLGVYVLLPFHALSSLFQHDLWLQHIILLIGITASMDTGAWFVGKRIGKNKLWPSVSPNKTVEGLIGGIFCSGLVGTIFSLVLFSKSNFLIFFIFCVLGLLSQLGDLIQSKIKRQFKIKDSSSLIPGHGGVYDRIDSLMFVAPFYAAAIKNIQA